MSVNVRDDPDQIRIRCLELVALDHRFRGQELYAPYFYERILSGDTVEMSDSARDFGSASLSGFFFKFSVTDGAREVFPELNEREEVFFRVDELNRVQEITRAEWDEASTEHDEDPIAGYDNCPEEEDPDVPDYVYEPKLNGKH